MNIYQKLIEVRKTVPYLKKENSGYQFNYVSSSQVLAALKNKMDEVGLLLIPKILNHKVTIDNYEKIDGKGNLKRTVDYFTELDMVFIWINSENSEEQIECPWYAQGLDTAGEKGVGKCVTYSEKYFMLKFFNIPTDKDDPDSFQQKLEDKEKMETKKLTELQSKIEALAKLLKATPELMTQIKEKCNDNENKILATLEAIKKQKEQKAEAK